jgi:hypothetical protein
VAQYKSINNPDLVVEAFQLTAAHYASTAGWPDWLLAAKSSRMIEQDLVDEEWVLLKKTGNITIDVDDYVIKLPWEEIRKQTAAKFATVFTVVP